MKNTTVIILVVAAVLAITLPLNALLLSQNFNEKETLAKPLQSQGSTLQVPVEGNEVAKVTNLQKSPKPKKIETKPAEAPKKSISEEEAKAIALGAVNGRVTDIEIESKFGKTVYAVEISDDGEEIDVFVDIQTGQVLGTEA